MKLPRQPNVLQTCTCIRDTRPKDGTSRIRDPSHLCDSSLCNDYLAGKSVAGAARPSDAFQCIPIKRAEGTSSGIREHPATRWEFEKVAVGGLVV